MKFSMLNNSLILDTNVIVSAHLSRNLDATTRRVYDLTYGQHWLIYSKDILREYVRVLSYPKFKFSPDLIRKILRHINQIGIAVIPSPNEVRLKDATDQPFYDLVTTKSAGVPVLVTGNLRHFPRENFIMSPREYLELLVHPAR